MSTKEQVFEIVAEALELPIGEVRPESRFADDLGANSLDIVNLIWRIEEVFNLGETPESVLEQIRTVGDVVDMVRGLRGEEASEAFEVVDLLIASDHAGVAMKAELVSHLRKRQISLVDLGPADSRSVDYPGFAELLTGKLLRGEGRLGVLICGTGNGMSIAANKVRGVRAALVENPVSARLTRTHNDANVLCLGSRIVGAEVAIACVDAFLDTPFDPGDDGRHRRRVKMIADLERGVGSGAGSGARSDSSG